MEFTVFDTDLNAVFVMDTYKSAIWTERYQQCGDFEIYTPVRNDILDNIKQGYYLQRRDSEIVMIVEKILIESNIENGNSITIAGRSLESILDRRIVWKQATISGDLQNGIKTLLEESIISPTNSDRKIDNFIFESSNDPIITNLRIDAQYTGDNLYDIVCKLCEETGIGFKITLNKNKQFVFKLYAGINRSYNQVDNPYVVFSPNFENIINSNYLESRLLLKNVTLIGGEGEGAARKYTEIGTGRGLNRRELFTDARDISSDVGDGKVLTSTEYIAQLQQRGKEKLAEHTNIVSFEGQIETSAMFRCGEDFFNGDIVQIANEYGHEVAVRITEIVVSEDEGGISIYPTFKTISKGEM